MSATINGPLFETRVERDICEAKHGNVRTSVQAYERGKQHHAAMRERCRVFIVGCGFHGTTAKEIARCFDVELHAISGRISELLDAQKIFDSKRDRRDGCRILVARREWINGGEE